MNAAHDELVGAVLDAHQLALDLQRQQQEAADARAELIRKALAAGVGATILAEALGVNRQRIYAMAKP